MAVYTFAGGTKPKWIGLLFGMGCGVIAAAGALLANRLQRVA